ncbi:MAG TPA: aminopeptidase P N-terminal domain-containing protein [Candidatus Saccharimonadales bacterium]|nr:aminopeptidase P N-terminal domain-containing protein [Candidatus Saccharimonadales bacterium]
MTSHLNSDFFTANRQRLLEGLPDDALVVMTAYSAMQRLGDAAFGFEQEASFYYLTGIQAADWRLIIDKSSGQHVLVAPSLDPVKLLFDGGLSAESASRISGIGDIITQDDMAARLRQLGKNRSVYTVMTPAHLKKAGFVINPALDRLVRQLKRQFGQANDLTANLLKLRTIKQPAEIKAIEQAIDSTVMAFDYVKQRLADYRHEYEVEADMTRQIRFTGAVGHAYEPIVASGLNACTLHYTANDRPFRTDQTLLIDVGARSIDGYAADISRTYAVQPTPRQRQVHRAVQDAQIQCIDLIKPGLKFADYQAAVDEIMKSAIESLGLDAHKYRRYFPHAVGHGLGLEVHDPLSGYDCLQPGMVLTVEPGIYIKEEDLGVRIEDDILVTDSGNRNLSAGLDTALD